MENIIFLSPRKHFINFVLRRIFNSAIFFLSYGFVFRYGPLKYVEVFFKLLLQFACLFQTKSKYILCGTRIFEIRDDTNHKIKHGKTFLSCYHKALFHCPGNITDNVVMTFCRHLKQLLLPLS